MNPTVSVLIPTKNRRKLLERSLGSIFKQTNPPDEIIVVNDGSDDDTKEFLNTVASLHCNLKLIHREISGGVNTARNQGIRESSSDWIAFLDDDEFDINAVETIRKKINEIPKDFFVVYLNSKIYRDDHSFTGGFQFEKLSSNLNFYDPSYEQTVTKFNLKGDCKPVFRRSLFENKKYLFPQSVNGFESYTMSLIARDKKGIRYFKDIATLIHQEDELIDRLSINAPRKNPWPLFVLHIKQIPDHFKFYITHPLFFLKKIKEMLKLLVRVFLNRLFVLKKLSLRLFGMQRWIRLGLRYRIILKQKYENYEFIIPFFGYKYRGNLNDYIDRFAYYFGAYEIEELLYLKKYLNKDSVVLDIGANSGHHSLFFSRFSKKVYSFEPYDKPFNILLSRIRENNIKNIECFNFGLGDKYNEMEFFAPIGPNGGGGSFISAPNKKNIGKLVIKKGDDFVKNFNDEKIDFIKIDVEGLENEVLMGLKETIKKYKPIMFVEMIPESQNDLDKDIKDLYNLYVIDANNPFLFLFNKSGCKIEKFLPSKNIINILFIPKD